MRYCVVVRRWKSAWTYHIWMQLWIESMWFHLTRWKWISFFVILKRTSSRDAFWNIFMYSYFLIYFSTIKWKFTWESFINNVILEFYWVCGTTMTNLASSWWSGGICIKTFVFRSLNVRRVTLITCKRHVRWERG